MLGECSACEELEVLLDYFKEGGDPWIIIFKPVIKPVSQEVCGSALSLSLSHLVLIGLWNEP